MTILNLKHGQPRNPDMSVSVCNRPVTFPTLVNEIFHDCLVGFLIVCIADFLIFQQRHEDILQPFGDRFGVAKR